MMQNHSASLRRIQAILDRSIARLGNVGGLIALQLPNRAPIILCSGSADLDARTPLKPESVCMIASQSKTIIALCVLRLIRRGLLDLTQPAAQLLRTIPLDPAITVEHLLMNRSGLGEYEGIMFGPSYAGTVHLEPHELVKLAALNGVRFAPGECFDYSNINFVLLGLGIEAVTGAPLAEAVRREILQPLGLEMWFAATEALPRARMAGGYVRSTNSSTPRHAAELDHSAAFATGDMAADLATMLRLWTALLASDNPIQISVADLTRNTTFAAPKPFHPASLGVEYGYGVEVAYWGGERVVGHPGKIQGYRSGTWADPARGIVISLCITGIHDQTEDAAVSALRYPAGQLYTASLGAAYA